jgi:hypothetical protein
MFLETQKFHVGARFIVPAQTNRTLEHDAYGTNLEGVSRTQQKAPDVIPGLEDSGVQR